MKRAALQAFAETITVKVPRQNEELAKRLMVQTAENVRDRVIAEQTARAGVRPDYVQVVNRARNAPLTSVTADGVILFEWYYLREIAEVAVQMLHERGPNLTGNWRNSIGVFVDDMRADFGAIDESTKLIEVAPTVPYARRLEIGKDKKGGPFIVNGPPHLVEETALILRRTYAKVANVRHTYVQLSGAAPGLVGRARNRAQADLRYPAIAIRPLAQ